MRRYTTIVEAIQWVPGDMEQAGSFVGQLMVLGIPNRIVAGTGASCVIEVGMPVDSATGPKVRPARVLPGWWLIIPWEGPRWTVSDHTFQTQFREMSDD